MKDSLRSIIERLPCLYLEILRRKRQGHWSAAWVVSRQTECVIEGFPRSANSFAHEAFKRSQPEDKPIGLATHTHSPAQIIQAVRWEIPTMVCVREPWDAVRGLMAFDRELKTREGSVVEAPGRNEIIGTARRWHFFHRQILAHHGSFFVAPFERIIRDYAALSQEFVTWSGRDWHPWDPTFITEEEIKGKSFHVGPNPEREAIKKQVDAAMEKSGLRDQAFWQEAERMHRDLITR